MKYTNPDHLILLIQSLTKAEKRYFRLYANLQSGEKNYLLLFDLINKGTPPRISVNFTVRNRAKATLRWQQNIFTG